MQYNSTGNTAQSIPTISATAPVLLTISATTSPSQVSFMAALYYTTNVHISPPVFFICKMNSFPNVETCRIFIIPQEMLLAYTFGGNL